MKLFVAEKPSLAKAIADGIGVKSRGDGFINCDDGSVVTWVFGHLLSLVNADVYDPKYKQWSFDNLPIMPDVMQKTVINNTGAKKQYGVIKKLLAKCTSVVNAGDPDREGQLLVDELLEDLNNKKPVQRILLAAVDLKSVKKSLADLRDNKDFQNLKMSAQARSEADWLYGINMTRAMTLTLKGQGGDAVLSIGRVQTPTLGLVVQRELQIKNFKPRDYFICQASLEKQGNEFTAKFLPENNENLGGDAEGYLVDKTVADQAKKDIMAKAIVSDFTVTNKKTNNPQCYALSTLQKDASAKLGFGAKKTLDVAQKLYEQGITSYPRSDCGFLPEEQLSDAPNVLKTIENVLDIAKKANTSIKSATWNTKKVSAHHGIVPTEKNGANLTGDERELYLLIAKRYVAQFFPPETYKAIAITIEDDGGHLWKSTGKVVLDKGWKVVYNDKEDDQTVPELKKGELLDCKDVDIKSAQTKPPSRFTEGTLIDAMSSIQNFVDNPKYKKILKETSGIGTEATRANVIETLINRSFVKKTGKNLVPTLIAMSMIQSLSPKMKDPGVTAIWEEYLKAIETGKMTYEQFIGEQKRFIPIFIADVKEIKFPKDVISSLPKRKPMTKSKPKPRKKAS